MLRNLRRTAVRQVIPICLMGVMILILHDFFMANSTYYQLDYETEQTPAFRDMRFPGGGAGRLLELAREWGEDPYDVMATAMIAGGYVFDGEKSSFSRLEYEQTRAGLRRQKEADYRLLRGDYEAIFADLACFPVMLDTEDDPRRLAYENGWGDKRTYGGDRQHEGIDLMDRENIRGILPVVSITDGAVTRMGWLEQGGYRIGVTSPSGAYFYYAHLAAYADGLEEGSEVRAGQLLGFMGDTGYSPIEGTTGNFDVHLHLGLYLHPGTSQETSVNPYYILQYLEDKKITYSRQ